MNNSQNLITYFMNASPIIKSVMLLLIATSLASWSIIFQKMWRFKQTENAICEFEDAFWSGDDLAKLYQDLKKQKQQPVAQKTIPQLNPASVGTAPIFCAGFREYMQLQQTNASDNVLEHTLMGVSRAMQISESTEQANLEQHLPFLATVASVSPYIGLFGTVLGIMTVFGALGSVAQVTISMVAPGISEALVATAMGLFASIPAFIAYNRFNTRLDGIINKMVQFEEEFLSLIQRQFQKSEANNSRARESNHEFA